MKKLCFLWILGCFLLCFIASCEKVNLPKDESEEVVDGVKLSLYVKPLEELTYKNAMRKTRSVVPIGSVCKRINLAVFQNGNRVKSVSQTNDKPDFGQFSMSLAKGSYQIVVIAHNGEGAATITSPTSVKFHNNKLTDTFYFYEEIKVEADHRQEVTLKRGVAKFVLTIKDALPATVARMEFKYTGGSSTFDAVAGVGNVHSRQTETRAVSTEMIGKSAKFEIYTFPRTDSKMLNITVTAQDAGGATLAERVFTEVAVQTNTISEYTGMFFGGFIDAHSREYDMKADTLWVRNPVIGF